MTDASPMPITTHSAALAAGAHGASLATILAVFVGVLPAIATVLAIVFYAVQIYESKTVQEWVHRYAKPKAPR